MIMALVPVQLPRDPGQLYNSKSLLQIKRLMAVEPKSFAECEIGRYIVLMQTPNRPRKPRGSINSRRSPIGRAILMLGGPTHAAKRLRTTRQVIEHWVKINRVVAERVLSIEEATGGRIGRWQLRPDIYPPAEYRSASSGPPMEYFEPPGVVPAPEREIEHAPIEAQELAAQA